MKPSPAPGNRFFACISPKYFFLFLVLAGGAGIAAGGVWSGAIEIKTGGAKNDQKNSRERENDRFSDQTEEVTSASSGSQAQQSKSNPLTPSAICNTVSNTVTCTG